MTLEPDPSSLPTPIDDPSGPSESATAADTTPDQATASRRKPLWREYTEAIIVAMLLAFAIRVFIV
jgi:signal peptidase I